MKAQTISQIQYKIYIDMDGVLCDFLKRVKDITNIKGDINDKKYKDPITKEYCWWKYARNKGEDFWSEMEFMKDGKKLWNKLQFYPYKEILTICGKNDFGRIGKIKWVENNLNTSIPINILSPHQSKSIYANKYSILIDDMDKNLKEWTNAGGIAIKHVSFANTYKELKKYINI